MADRTFAKFTFFKIDPAWRRRDPELRATDKQEFLAACEDFATDRSLRAYSTIGTRGDVDLLVLSQSPNLDDLHTFHVVLGQSGLAKWAETPHSFLSMTKRSPYSDEQARPEICVSERKYLFLYPMVKQRRWYGLPAEERGRIMKSHIEVGRRYPEITINTSYSFGLDDQEFVVAFEGDDPGHVPRPRQRAAPDRVERVHRARDPDLHLRGDVGAQGAGRPRRRRRAPSARRSVARGGSHRLAMRRIGNTRNLFHDRRSALSYAIDDQDRLIKVDEGYYRFAEENGWDGAGASLGRTLWDFVAGARDAETPADAAAAGAQRGAGRRAAVPLRRAGRAARDGHPDRRRPHRPRCALLGPASLETEAREAPQPMFDPKAARGTDLLAMCAWCDRFLVDDEWVEIEEAATRLELFRRSQLPKISHGICPSCSEMLLAA